MDIDILPIYDTQSGKQLSEQSMMNFEIWGKKTIMSLNSQGMILQVWLKDKSM